MDINTNTSVNTASSLVSTVSVSDLQKKAQEQKAEQREQIKPVVEQVYISQQAQELLDTYTTSYNNAIGNESSTSSSSTSSVNTAQIIDSVDTVQNRQTAAAIAEYRSQQAESTPPEQTPEVTPYAERDSTSIRVIA
ncbi:hypothetical protein [Chitinibacter sp. S2-10]|uniref:hypothetical protein n=1 Tax=Chitinibacter sp. S2-10 TaxID=3373597 RepID=UPI0039774687